MPAVQTPRPPGLDAPSTFSADGSRKKLHPADVSGRWQVRKNVIYSLLALIYAALPWIEIGGRQAVLFDVPRRQAFLFGATFTNQDFYLLFFLLSGAGFALIVATSLWGRVWCGFACPQTVWMEGFYRRIERWIEGPREARIGRGAAPASSGAVARKLLKYAVFLGLSVAVAHVFVSYFIPARDLLAVIRSGPSAHWTAFVWVVVMTAVLFFDFAWFREQTCLVVCPYGRIQSALIDDHTVVIGYDATRGEPRVKATETGGDCVDCRRCVVVCPTGIDIRNGLQMECVGCANCIDACDEIMGKLGRAPGLVRYDSKRGFDGATRRFWRPRVALYLGLGVIGFAAFAWAAAGRTSFEVRALRTRGMPYLIEETSIRNLFNLAVQNKRPEPRTVTVRLLTRTAPDGTPLEIVLAESTLQLEAMGDATVPVFVRMPRDRYVEPFALAFVVEDAAAGERREVEVHFLGP